MIDKVSASQPLHESGSPQSGGPVFLAVGKLQRTHGVKGEIIMEVLTDFPDKITPGMNLFIGSRHKEYQVASVRPSAEKMLISFSGLTDCDQVSILRNQLVYIKTADANQLPEGEFYHHEIVGMQVVDENGQPIGSIQEILVTGANDVYVVFDEDGKEILLPAIRSVVLSINKQSKRMVVRLPEWE